MNVYTVNGFKDREDYLKSLCEQFDSAVVYALSDILGESEDFDGLIASLKDYDFKLH
jgi:hypothetical protein